MQSFVAVIKAGSFVAAATALDTSKAAVSRHIADLENRLGVRLINRTTRKLSLTVDGQTFFMHCQEILSALNEAESDLSSRSPEASGLLRISVPVTFGVLHLAPLWGEFLAQHPKISLDVIHSDRHDDLIEDGLDLAVRIAAALHPTLIGRRLATTRLVLCATPAYLARRGVPQHPGQLPEHDIISYSYWSSRDEWTFQGPGGPATVKLSPRMHTNNGDACKAVALQHQGIILQPAFIVDQELRSGALVEIMPSYQAGALTIHAVYATRKHLPLKLRQLIDFLAQRLHTTPWVS
ncbi:LysR family transcriptional regulator [Janthinobacterium agaricidamnosum]